MREMRPTGALTYGGVLKDGVNGVDGLDGARSDSVIGRESMSRLILTMRSVGMREMRAPER